MQHEFDPYYLTSEQRLDVAKLLLQHAVDRQHTGQMNSLVQLINIIQHKVNIDDTFAPAEPEKNTQNKNKI